MDSDTKSIESISLEGIRHQETNSPTPHQKLRVIIENWKGSDEYKYGDMDGPIFSAKLAKMRYTPIFSAFEHLEFFFLPNEKHDNYSHYFDKLLTLSLDSTYLVPKKFGAFIKASSIINELNRYVEAIGLDSEFTGTLTDFFPANIPGTSEENVLSNNKSVPGSIIEKQEDQSTPNKSKETKTRKSPKGKHDASGLRERRHGLPSSYSSKDETKKNKSTIPNPNGLVEVVNPRKPVSVPNIQSEIKTDDSITGKLKEAKDVIDFGKLAEHSTQSFNTLQDIHGIDKGEKFDVLTFIQKKMICTDEKIENLKRSSGRLPTPSEILDRISKTNNSSQNKDNFLEDKSSDGNAASLEKIGLAISPFCGNDKTFDCPQLLENGVTTQDDTRIQERKTNPDMLQLQERNKTPDNLYLLERNATPDIGNSQLQERNISFDCPQLVERKDIFGYLSSPERSITPTMSNFSKRNTTGIDLVENKFDNKITELSCGNFGEEKQRVRPLKPVAEVFSVQTMNQIKNGNINAENSKWDCYAKKQIESYVINSFKKVPVQSRESVDDIIQNVQNVVKKSLPESNKVVEGQRSSVSQAITAILMYIEAMENAFKKYFNFSHQDFEKQHDSCYEKAMSFFGNSNYLKEAVDMKIGEAKRIFQTLNNNYLLHQQASILNAVQGVKQIYSDKMKINNATDEYVLLKRHEEVMGNLLKAATISCNVNKSSWSNDLLPILEKELNKLYEQQKRAIENLKISKRRVKSAVENSVFYYKNEMDRMLGSGTISQLSQFNSHHDTKYSEALGRFGNSIEKEPRDISLDGENGLKFEIEKLSSTLRNDFITRLNTEQRQRPHLSKLDEGRVHSSEGITELRGPEVDGSFQNRCIGIHLDFSEIIAAHLTENGHREIYRKEDPHIGYNGKLFIKGGKNIIDFVFDNVWENSLVNLKDIFKVKIGEIISINWNGSTKSFRAEELISFILYLIKVDCEKTLGGDISVCTIAVPSHFSAVEAQAVRDAAVIAGLKHIQVLREICLAGIGSWFCTDDSDTFPKEFILVNTLAEKWDAGYYKLSQGFSPLLLSGDKGVSSGIFHIGNKEQSRLKNILVDIIKRLPESQSERINVVIIGKNNCYLDLNSLRHKGTKFTFFSIGKSTINIGAAFTSALMGNDPHAQQLWDDNHPVSSTKKRYTFETILNTSWTAPQTSSKFAAKSRGTNLEPSQIRDLKNHLDLYITASTTNNSGGSFYLW